MKSLILEGHVLDKLRELPRGHFHTVITSPPYYAKRWYKTQPQIWGGKKDCTHAWRDVIRKKTSGKRQRGPGLQGSAEHQEVASTQFDMISQICTRCNAWRGELGQEPTPALYLKHLLSVCRGVHRVLRDDGTFWLNVADSSAGSGQGGGGGSFTERMGDDGMAWGGDRGRKAPPCWRLKQKDLMLIPFRIAIGLQMQGWWVRQIIIWHKPNGLPESPDDRPTTAHEFIFLLSKSDEYFYDAHAIKEPAKTDTIARLLRGRNPHKHMDGAPGQTAHTIVQPKLNISDKSFTGMALAHKRSVWTITVASYSGNHFATFPPEIPELCIKAGTSRGGCCPKCHAPYERILEDGEPDLDAQRTCGGNEDGDYFGHSIKDHAAAGVQDASEVKRHILKGMIAKKTVGWQSVCKCSKVDARALGNTADLLPPRVLDPFAGSGTTGQVALELGCEFTGIELHPDNVLQCRENTREFQPALIKEAV